MYKLDQIIKALNTNAKEFPKDHIARQYYKTIVAFLLIEHKHKDIILECRKPIYHYFQYYLPQRGREYFEFLYSPYNPVRFAVETFDSIEELREDIKKFHESK